MWKGCLASLGLSLAGAGLALAQVPRPIAEPVALVSESKLPGNLPVVIADSKPSAALLPPRVRREVGGALSDHRRPATRCHFRTGL